MADLIFKLAAVAVIAAILCLPAYFVFGPYAPLHQIYAGCALFTLLNRMVRHGS